MSAAWASGSSRAWRRLRAAVLDRDGHRCKVPVGEQLCGAVARTVGHVDPLADGHPKLAPMHRLRAECSAHNYGAGAADGNRRRLLAARTWTW